jgi:hypothetical protein
MSRAAAPRAADHSAAFAPMFPLPLSTMEWFMWADGRPEYPMMCDLELHFRGRVNRAAFDAGLAAAMDRAPLFRSLVEPRRKGPPVWVLTDRMPEVDWAPFGAPWGEKYDTLIDLTAEPGLRVYVREGHDRSAVRLHFHHACADGIGGYAFIEDFLAGYSQAFPDGAATRMRPLEPRRLVGRGDPGTAGRGVYRGIVDTLVGAREGARFFLQKPLPLAPVEPSPASATAARRQVGFIAQSCPDEVAVGLRGAATAARVSVNDLVMRDLFVTLRRWNAEHEREPGRRRLRILMPQNLRERADRAMPATNLLGFAFVTRRADQCLAPRELLASIHEETEAVRRGQLSRYFIGGLAAVQSAGMLRRVLDSSLCFSTAILTNLGDPTRRFVARFPRGDGGLVVGNLLFDRIEGVPPLRPRTRAAFSLFNSARTLSISLKCDPHLFSPADTQELMNQFLAQLAESARA